MSGDRTNDGARLEAVETKIVHQEQMIADLNEVITAQWRKIDTLERQIARLLDEVQSLAPARDGPERPPPHY